MLTTCRRCDADTCMSSSYHHQGAQPQSVSVQLREKQECLTAICLSYGALVVQVLQLWTRCHPGCRKWQHGSGALVAVQGMKYETRCDMFVSCSFPKPLFQPRWWTKWAFIANRQKTKQPLWSCGKDDRQWQADLLSTCPVHTHWWDDSTYYCLCCLWPETGLARNESHKAKQFVLFILMTGQMSYYVRCQSYTDRWLSNMCPMYDRPGWLNWRSGLAWCISPIIIDRGGWGKLSHFSLSAPLPCRLGKVEPEHGVSWSTVKLMSKMLHKR